MKKPNKRSFDVLSAYSWYVPGVGGMFYMLLWLLVGAVLGNLLSFVLVPVLGQEAASQYGVVLAYPLMFIPAMIAAKLSANKNMLFENGYSIDSKHFGKTGFGLMALFCVFATLATGFCAELIGSVLPPMPEHLKSILEGLTQGPFLLNFLCVSIMAPFFEEWLCRGTILRGLLNYQKSDGSRGMKPSSAICISAVFFALIHLNPWQAIPAFLLGLVFGYVYYRTGSLKLTMLMHFVNNTFALVLGQFDTVKEYDTISEMLPVWLYSIILVLSLAIIFFFIKTLRKINLDRPQGNSDELPVE